MLKASDAIGFNEGADLRNSAKARGFGENGGLWHWVASPATRLGGYAPLYNADKTFDEAARPWCVPARWHVDVITRYHHGKLHAYLLLNRG